MRKCLLCAAALAAFLLGGGSASAQNATVEGIVRDASGAVLPGATVTAKNEETGLTRTAVADGVGQYHVRALPPGRYTLVVELSGFTTEARQGVVLIIEQTAALDFTLKPAALAETLTVTGESPIIDTSRSDVATSVSTQQIQDLPVASRRWIDLAMLTPGTSQDNIRGFFYRGNVNVGAGTREYSNGFMVDGVNNTWAEMGEPRQNFAMDSIREFRVSTSTYKAEYGLATGGVVSVVSKSGTNTFHGSGLLFFRDKSLTAREFFQARKPDYRRYQYGATIGGPIVKDKTHFFFAYEGTKEKQFFTVSSGGLWPEYDGTYPSKQNRWTYLGRLDHQLSAKQTLFARVAAEDEYRPIITTGGRVHPTNSFDFAVPRDSVVIGHTWVMTDRAVNDFRVQRAYAKYIVAPPNSNSEWDPGDFGQDRLDYCTPVFNYPSVAIGGCGNSQMGPETRWQIKDDFSYLVTGWGGQHQLKTGADFSYIPFQYDNMGNPPGNWTFPKDAPYNPGDPTTWPTLYTNTLPTYGDIPVKHFSTYVQDDWEVTQNLTFNLGLRYDLQTGVFLEDVPALLQKIQDKLGRDGSFPIEIPTALTNGYSGRGDRNNFGPRAGIAWDPRGNGVTNVHAAYGLFYDNIRTLLQGGELTWPQAKGITIPRPSFPDPFQGRSRDQFLSGAPPNITVNSSDFVNPYAHQANLGISRQLTRNTGITADGTFVWRYSDRNDPVDPNLPDPVTRAKPYPQFGRVSFLQSTADNTYKALLVKLEKRMSNNYQYLVSYTLSQSEDTNFTETAPDAYGFVSVTRPAAGDRRHRLVVSGIVALPWQTQISAIGDFRSSLRFNPSTSVDLDGDGYIGDLPSGVEVGSGCRGLNLDAVNAYRTSRRLTTVSEVSCPQFANMDVRFSKFFSFAGQHRVEFIAQLFNIFDRANYNVPNGNVGSGNDLTGRPLFGQSTQLLPNINAPSRQVEFAIRYQF
jgi:outer membrane receptor protein involved in Fe transport